MSHNHQENAAKAHHAMACAVIIVSDTRTPETDVSGKWIMETLKGAGHKIAAYEIVRDEPDQIIRLVEKLALSCQLILLSGGTGIAKRDTTYEAISGLLEKEIGGFGELFRMLSYAEIGPAAMLSRATGGLFKDTLIFSLPGSTGAVTLAMTELILPELDHMAYLVEG